ncbi:glucose-6-phosphate isomerase [Helicobacter sp. 16-1353]|uniref:glucose-6-phosphate isomerase n=1 Tax=Helicobacter sp. 16-1353 TaxID=2004996 RepID=UPI000DCE2459|nr:glucose-6-phosphate isomerase [Helicobacter sp. 16-1353]RAX52719.1 glucose-6-phosphate isomerase [Helicobacter sp. 16-1353]
MLKFKEYFTKSSSSKIVLPENSINKEALETLFKAICEERDSKISGFHNLPYEKKAILDSKKYIRENIHLTQNIDNLIIIGIGGSSLGLKAIDTMLSHLPYRKNINLKFLEHTDPIKIEKSLKKVRLNNSLFIVISKSGTTIETLSLMKYVLKRYDLLKNDKNKQHLCFITDINSPLHKFGNLKHIATLTINKNIGGRYSVLSTIGILPLMILGYDVENLLLGARKFSTRFFQRKEEHLLRKAIFLSNNREKFHINILFSYSSVFKDFNAWYVQLWGESLGKLNSFGKKTGLTPIALIGSIDQHSFLQLIVQGVMDKTITFLSLEQKSYINPKIPNIRLKFLDSCNFVNGESFALLLQQQQISTMEVIQKEGIPTDHIEIKKLNEKSIGALIMYYEILTSCVGKILDINAYDQPGVELGKKILITKFKKSK